MRILLFGLLMDNWRRRGSYACNSLTTKWRNRFLLAQKLIDIIWRISPFKIRYSLKALAISIFQLIFTYLAMLLFEKYIAIRIFFCYFFHALETFLLLKILINGDEFNSLNSSILDQINLPAFKKKPSENVRLHEKRKPFFWTQQKLQSRPYHSAISYDNRSVDVSDEGCKEILIKYTFFTYRI